MKLVNWLRATAAGAIVACAGMANAEPLKVASVAPEASVWYAQMMQFVEALKASDTGLEVEVFGNGQLGNMPDTLKSTLSGRIDIWVGAVPVLAAVTPEMGLFNLPYLFDSGDQAKCAIPKMLEKGREAAGGKYELLTFAPVGGQDVFGAKPIRVPADLKGAKIRTAPIPASIAFFTAMGATPQALPASETASAVSTGLVEALEFDIVYYMLTGANKGATYMTQTDQNHNLGAYVMSARSWAKLDDAQKEAVRNAAAAFDFAAAWDGVKAFEGVMLEKAKATGTEEITLTPEEKALWVEAGRSVWDKVAGETRGDPKGFLDALEDARAACN